jgi:hypothetical protein
LIGTPNPVADLHTHWSLRVVSAVKCKGVSIVDSSDKVAVDIPFHGR